MGIIGYGHYRLWARFQEKSQYFRMPAVGLRLRARAPQLCHAGSQVSIPYYKEHSLQFSLPAPDFLSGKAHTVPACGGGITSVRGVDTIFCAFNLYLSVRVQAGSSA